jgi:hypothetical protein
MMHGEQTLLLTKESVAEALGDYLAKHFKSAVTLESWGAPGYGALTIECIFTDGTAAASQGQPEKPGDTA